VCGEVAGADILAVTPVVGESQRLVVDGFEKALRPTAMLDIGQSVSDTEAI